MTAIGTGQPERTAPASAASTATITAARPTGHGWALTAAATLGAVALLGLAAVLVQQALADGGAVATQGWLTAALAWFDGAARGVAIAVAVGIALLGVLALVAAFGSGRGSATDLPARPGLTMDHGDLARASSAAARAVSGVVSATSTVTARRVLVTVSSTGDPRTAGEVERAVVQQLAGIGVEREVRVRTQQPGSASPLPRGDDDGGDVAVDPSSTRQEVHHA